MFDINVKIILSNIVCNIALYMIHIVYIIHIVKTFNKDTHSSILFIMLACYVLQMNWLHSV